MLDIKKKDIYRRLQSKGFGLPQIQYADNSISDEVNHRYFLEGLEICKNCSLGLCSAKTLGSGPVTSPLMIVGDSSKDDIEELEMPFTGPAGYFLTMALQVLGVDRRSIYITNVIKCNSLGTPSPDEIATCKPYLEYELDRVKPKIIIALGNTAVTYLKARGQIVYCETELERALS